VGAFRAGGSGGALSTATLQGFVQAAKRRHAELLPLLSLAAQPTGP